MWDIAEITVIVEETDPPTMLVKILTPLGQVDLIGDLELVEDTLRIARAHIGGLSANALGVAGLNAIGRKLLEEAGVENLVVEGGARTTGRSRGRIPRVIRFPRG